MRGLLRLRVASWQLNELCIPYIHSCMVREMVSGLNSGLYLHRAAERCLHDLMATLLALEAPLENTDERGETALHAATSNNCLASVQQLLRAGANADARSVHEWTPLLLA